jgi:hypothetical protein
MEEAGNIWKNSEYFCPGFGIIFYTHLIMSKKNQHSVASFPVLCSVRQGGVASAYAFAVYMDALSLRLNSSGVGCHIGNTITNHLAFADDYCLLASSISSLKVLLSICEEYATEHNLTFNPSKTMLQAFIPRDGSANTPKVVFCNSILEWKQNVRYLGYDVSCWNRDELELEKRRREIYTRSNILASRFKKCSVNIKKYLFNTYLGAIYCQSLWCPNKQEYLRKVKVAYNDAFRYLFSYSRMSSASQMFAENRVNDFTAIWRKAAFSLLTRISNSSNKIVGAIYNSMAFVCSSTFLQWRKLLLGANSDAIIIV